MSAAQQNGRQTKLTTKTRFALMLDDENYDWLDAQSRARRLSIAAILNELLRKLREVPHGIEAP